MPGAIWQPQLEALGDRFRVVALDPRGQGDSDVPIAASAYSVDRRADDLHDVLRTLPPVVLVGWSLGVLEALHYLHRHGDARVRALMLVDNSVGEPPAPQPSDFLARLRTDRAGTVERFVRGMFATAQPEPRIALLVRSVLQAPLDASVALLSYPLPREHWRRIARAVRRPLAYAVTPRFAAQARSLEEHRPGTQVEVFEQSGHALFVDAAARFNATLARFAAAAAS
jgi:microsomal epoxide hydrolase